MNSTRRPGMASAVNAVASSPPDIPGMTTSVSSRSGGCSPAWPQRLLGARGRQRLVAGLGEQPAAIARTDASSSTTRTRLAVTARDAPARARTASAPVLARRRQRDPDRRPAPRRGLDRRRGRASRHDPVDDRQAEPGACTGRLGREEGLEGTLDDVGRHAAPVIGDREPDVAAGRDPDVTVRVAVVELDVLRRRSSAGRPRASRRGR